MTKVIATDLDGTLFYPKDKKNMICEKNLFFLQSFIDNGGEVILVTGRSFEFGLRAISRIDRKCSLVCYNGGLVYDGEKVISSKTISNEVTKKLIVEMEEKYKLPGIFMMTEDGLFVHLHTKSKLIRKVYIFYYNRQGEYAEKIDYTEEAFHKQVETGKIYKLLLFFGLGKRRKERASKACSQMRKEIPELEANWSTNCIEISAKGCYKSKCLRELCQHKGYKDEDVYVVGDSGNDISMFKEYYENSFCMGHSPEKIRKYARFTLNEFEDLSRYIYKK